MWRRIGLSTRWSSQESLWRLSCECFGWGLSFECIRRFRYRSSTQQPSQESLRRLAREIVGRVSDGLTATASGGLDPDGLSDDRRVFDDIDADKGKEGNDNAKIEEKDDMIADGSFVGFDYGEMPSLETAWLPRLIASRCVKRLLNTKITAIIQMPKTMKSIMTTTKNNEPRDSIIRDDSTNDDSNHLFSDDDSIPSLSDDDLVPAHCTIET